MARSISKVLMTTLAASALSVQLACKSEILSSGQPDRRQGPEKDAGERDGADPEASKSAAPTPSPTAGAETPVPDPNYPGIIQVGSVTASDVHLFHAAAAGADAIQLQCTPEEGSPVVLMATPSSTSTVVTLPYSGTTYSCKATAIWGTTKIDGKSLATVQAASATAQAYRGPLLVKAFGPAPTAPAGPKTAQVSITWRPFEGAVETTRYHLVRAKAGEPLDPKTTLPCTADLDTSCLVCEATGAGALTCVDDDVASSPARYDYSVGLLTGGRPEAIPAATDHSYRMTVPIPPSDMVLVHRASVNFEACQAMGRTSDPLNHQRCPYAGLGAVPHSTGPGKPPLSLSDQYLDFGYNLFVDRWEAGCSWSTSGNGVPSGGADKDRFYSVSTTVCYINHNGTWKAANDATLPSSYRALLYTSQPTDKTQPTPPLVSVNQAMAYDACDATVDPNYGKKRLLRFREFVAASAWPTTSGEPSHMTETAAALLEDGVNFASKNGCNTGNLDGLTLQGFGSGDETSRNIASGLKCAMLGSTITSNCTSRFGAQDLIGNAMEWTSDILASCDPTAYTCAGSASVLDAGNRDWENFSFNGVQGPGLYTPVHGSYVTGSTLVANYFSVPLGLPLVTDDNGHGVALSGSFLTRLNADYINISPHAGSYARGALAGHGYSHWAGSGRYGLELSVASTTTHSRYGFRCALPAE